MRTTHTLETVNSQLIKAVDIILAYNRLEGLPVTSDSAMGKIISPTFPSIVKELRKGARNVPHIGLVRFVASFPYDMNYFYNKDLDFIYPPQSKEPTLAAKTVEDKLDNTLKDFFFENPEVSKKEQETLLVLKKTLVEVFNTTSAASKKELLDQILSVGMEFVTQNSQDQNQDANTDTNNALAIALSNAKTELINHQRDYKTLSQKYVALLEKQLG